MAEQFFEGHYDFFSGRQKICAHRSGFLPNKKKEQVCTAVNFINI
jgi:hypothetical protein